MSGKVDVSGGGGLGQNPFAGLEAAKFPAPPSAGSPPAASTPVAKEKSLPRAGADDVKNRGRVDILRSTAGRGGKTVTLVQGFVGIGLPEKEHLAKQMQKRCGCGGTVKDGRIEIQGDKREEVAKILMEAGFRPVFAGG